MKKSQIAIWCALVLNLILIILVANGTWDTKSKVGCDPECSPQYEGPEYEYVKSKFEYCFN